MAAPPRARVPAQAITVLCSEKGWLRAVPEHLADPSAVRYKEGDRGRFILHALSSDRILIFGADGRFYTLACDRLPAGRGFGEPLRLIVDLPQPFEPLAMHVHRPGGRLLVASAGGRGFGVEEEDALGQTRAGKAVLLPGEGDRAAHLCALADGDDSVAVVGSNRRLLIFPLAELPVMSKGRGVLLQRYRDAQLADIATFSLARGLTWRGGRGMRTETDLRPWLGRRGQLGHVVPRGFPMSNQFAG